MKNQVAIKNISELPKILSHKPYIDSVKQVLSKDGAELDKFVNFIEDLKHYITESIVEKFGD